MERYLTLGKKIVILREATPAKVACIPPFVLRRIATKFITKFYDNTGAHLNTEYGDLVNPPPTTIHFILSHLTVASEAN